MGETVEKAGKNAFEAFAWLDWFQPSSFALFDTRVDIKKKWSKLQAFLRPAERNLDFYKKLFPRQ